MDRQVERPPVQDLDPRVQAGLAAGLLLVALGVLVLPWVEFNQAAGGATSYGFNELRTAFHGLDGIDGLLGSLMLWAGIGIGGLAFGIASLLPTRSGGTSARQDSYLPALPLALCLLMLWRVNHYLSDAAGVFILAGVDAHLGSGGIVASLGCGVVLAAVFWGHQMPRSPSSIGSED